MCVGITVNTKINALFGDKKGFVQFLLAPVRS